MRVERELRWHSFLRELRKVGLHLSVAHPSIDTIDINRFEPAVEYAVLEFRPAWPRSPPESMSASLLIKTCVMEFEAIEGRVRHLIEQLDRPRPFLERVLLIDNRRDDFLRQYVEITPESIRVFEQAVRRLLETGWIDRVLCAPEDTSSIEDVCRSWYNVENARSHAANRAPLTGPLFAFGQLQGDIILQVDSDLLIVRADANADYLWAVEQQMKADPLCLTISLPTAIRQSHALFWDEERDKPFRVEVRGCFFNRQALLQSRPWPLALQAGGWHRQLDQKINENPDAMRSYRMQLPGLAYVHPPNDKKHDAVAFSRLTTVVSHAIDMPPAQTASVDLVVPLRSWLETAPGLVRKESFVFVVCGRNVPVSRMRRCLDSIQLQQRQRASDDWGCIVIDDNSEESLADYLQYCAAINRQRLTFFRQQPRAGLLSNTAFAIRSLCVNPQCVVILVDLDDCLIGDCVLSDVHQLYVEQRMEATVGTMLRTDKSTPPSLAVDLVEPRAKRGGGVWNHLRTFKRELFLKIDDKDLTDKRGHFWEEASDWAIMLPIIEMANRPFHLRRVVYLHEPGGPRTPAALARREANIAAIVRRPSYSRNRISIGVIGHARCSLAEDQAAEELGELLARTGLYHLVTGGLGGVMEAACRGFQQGKRTGGHTIGVLPGLSRGAANRFVDFAMPTGLQAARNQLIALSDALVMVGGGSGTYSELYLAASLNHRKPIIALVAPGIDGASRKLAGQLIDHRSRRPIPEANSPLEVLQLLETLLHPENMVSRALE